MIFFENNDNVYTLIRVQLIFFFKITKKRGVGVQSVMPVTNMYSCTGVYGLGMMEFCEEQIINSKKTCHWESGLAKG